MKKLFLIFIVLAANQGLYAQDSGKKANVHFRHAGLRQAFTELEKKYDLNFSYNETNLALYTKETRPKSVSLCSVGLLNTL